MTPYTHILILLISAPCLLAQSVANLDFAYAHGTVINNQYAAQGITISINGGQNIGIVYDSELGGVNGGTIDGADPDLERLSSAGVTTGWDDGNLGTDYNAGGLLIIQENAALASAPTYGSGTNEITSASNYDPDDNAGGGTITFDIDANNFTYNYFNVVLADFEEGSLDFSATLYGVNGAIEVYSFGDFTDPAHASYDPTITVGDNHVNAMPEISLTTGEAIDSVVINFDNSSGSVSGIIFSATPVPEPSGISLLALAGLSLLVRRKR